MSQTQKICVFLACSKLLFEYYNGQQRPDFFLKRMFYLREDSKKTLKKNRRVSFSEDCKVYDGHSPRIKLFKEFLDDIFGPKNRNFDYVKNLYHNCKQDELRIISELLEDLIQRCEALPDEEAKTPTIIVGSKYSYGATRRCIPFFKQNLKRLRVYINS